MGWAKEADAGLISTVPVVANKGLVPFDQLKSSTAMLMFEELVGTRLPDLEPQ